MAKKYFLDKRSTVSGKPNEQGYDDFLDVNDHIEKVVEVAEFTSLEASTIVADTVSEQTAAAGVTVDGALIKDGSFTGKQATATATAAGLTTGALTGADQFVTVTSASADNVICLPLSTTLPIGTTIRGWVGANGFELRPIAAEAATATINGVTTSVEAAIPATTFFTVTKVAALTFILTATTELGAVITAIVPDAIV